MSRLYWHTRTWAAELHGSEYVWLRYLATLQADAAWQLKDAFMHDVDRVEKFFGWISPAERNYVHPRFTEWQTVAASKLPGSGYRAGQLWRELMRDLTTYLRVNGYWLTIGEHKVHTLDVGFNAAVACGSPPIQLAAKLAGYGEVHCYVEGHHRAWLADVVQEGLDKALYRRELAIRDVNNNVIDVLPQGWQQVLELLRADADGPVVLSYSVTNNFPNPVVADFLTDTDVDGEPDLDKWYRLTDDERWSLGVAGVRRRPRLELSPTTLGGSYFGPAMTPFDLWAPDAVERVRRACEELNRE